MTCTCKTDTHGRPWALMMDVKEDDILITDGGFTCIRAGEECVVHFDLERWEASPGLPEVSPQDFFYVLCDEGKHFIDGQLEQDDMTKEWFYIGFYLKGVA